MAFALPAAPVNFGAGILPVPAAPAGAVPTTDEIRSVEVYVTRLQYQHDTTTGQVTLAELNNWKNYLYTLQAHYYQNIIVAAGLGAGAGAGAGGGGGIAAQIGALAGQIVALSNQVATISGQIGILNGQVAGMGGQLNGINTQLLTINVRMENAKHEKINHHIISSTEPTTAGTPLMILRVENAAPPAGFVSPYGLAMDAAAAQHVANTAGAPFVIGALPPTLVGVGVHATGIFPRDLHRVQNLTQNEICRMMHTYNDNFGIAHGDPVQHQQLKVRNWLSGQVGMY